MKSVTYLTWHGACVILMILALLVVMFTVNHLTATVTPARNSNATLLSEVIAQTATSLDGTFSGTVAIAQPFALGTFDLVINLTSTGNTITGSVDASRTQVVSGTVQLRGSITGTTSAGKPTFRIVADPFIEAVAGRAVTRRFEIVGEVTPEGRLKGTYTETVTGFTPKPLTTKGAFLLVSSFMLNGPGASPPPGTRKLYLPLVRK